MNAMKKQRIIHHADKNITLMILLFVLSVLLLPEGSVCQLSGNKQIGTYEE